MMKKSIRQYSIFCHWYYKLLEKGRAFVMKQHYDNIDEYISDLKKEIAANDKCANHYYNLGMAFLHKRILLQRKRPSLDAL